MKVDVFLKPCPFPEDNVFFRRFRSSFQTGFQVVIRRDDEGGFAVCPEGLRSNFSDQKLERFKNKKYRIRIHLTILYASIIYIKLHLCICLLCCGSGSGAFLTHGYDIRDPEEVFSGSGILDP
jgi:hypothetical protein